MQRKAPIWIEQRIHRRLKQYSEEQQIPITTAASLLLTAALDDQLHSLSILGYLANARLDTDVTITIAADSVGQEVTDLEAGEKEDG